MKDYDIPNYILASGQNQQMRTDKLIEQVGKITLIENIINICLQLSKKITIVTKELKKLIQDSYQICLVDGDKFSDIPKILLTHKLVKTLISQISKHTPIGTTS